MAWWFYLVAVFAPVLLVNGIPHFVNGVSGRMFPTIFTGGIANDTPFNNVAWGAANLIVGGILLWLIRDGLSNVVMIVEMVVIGTAFAATLARQFGRTNQSRS